MHWVQFTIYAAQCILCTIYGICWIEACDKLQNFMNLHCKGKLNSWLPTQKKFQIICKKKYCLITCKGEPQCPGLLLRSPLCLRRRSGEGNQRDGGLQTFSAVPAWVDVKERITIKNKAIWSLVKRMKPGGVLQWLHGLRCRSCLTQVQEAACSAP